MTTKTPKDFFDENDRGIVKNFNTRLDTNNGDVTIIRGNEHYLFKADDIGSFERLKRHSPAIASQVVVFADRPLNQLMFLDGYQVLKHHGKRPFNIIRVRVGGKLTHRILYGDTAILDQKCEELNQLAKTGERNLFDYNNPEVPDSNGDVGYYRQEYKDMRSIQPKEVDGELCNFKVTIRGVERYFPTRDHFLITYMV